MEYNTRDIYFGKPTYNHGADGFWKTAFEPFIKQDDKYLSINTTKNGKRLLLPQYVNNTNEYLTVSELSPIVEQMGDKEIPEKISKKKINLYLFKFVVKQSFVKKNDVNDFQKTR